jgi:hypothetical protein
MCLWPWVLFREWESLSSWKPIASTVVTHPPISNRCYSHTLVSQAQVGMPV